MNKLSIFIDRLKRINIKLDFIGNYPWLYLDKINDKKVIEKFQSEHGFVVGYYPIRNGQEFSFSDISEIFKIMNKHCSFSDIGQYREIVDSIRRRYRYVGRDENDDPIYDDSKTLPVITFGGTCKLHGTNSSVCMNRDGQIWVQSKENILDIHNDNAGFCFFVESHIEVFRKLFSTLDFNGYEIITIFGEWCGKGIQKKVAICELPKMFVIFDIKRSYYDNEQGNSRYSDEDEIKTLRSVENQIYNIYDYKTYSVTIDFNDPGNALEALNVITTEVDKECPVGLSFGVVGHGEGVVYCYIDEDGNKYRFKVKGDTHKISKTDKLVSIDVEKVNSVKEFVEYAVTENRLDQGLEKTFGIGGQIDIKKMGDFLKWVVGDVMKEETDVLVKNGLIPKDVTSAISTKGRLWLMEKLNTY